MGLKGRTIQVSEDILVDALSYYFNTHSTMNVLKGLEFVDFIDDVVDTEQGFVFSIFLSEDKVENEG